MRIKGFGSWVSGANRPHGTLLHSRTGVIRIAPDEDESFMYWDGAKNCWVQLHGPISFTLTPTNLRSLARASIRALAGTKVPRRKNQTEATWEAAIDQKIEPIMAVLNGILPTNKVKKAS